MSPIKRPENYPPDWKRIRESILARAGHRCECVGECGENHYDLEETAWRALWKTVDRRCDEEHGKLGDRMNGKVVLTVAHLDHDAAAGNHSPENLKAMCQACHLRYDGFHRAMQRRERQGQEALL